MPSSSKPKPSEVAADTKRNWIPWIRNELGLRWPPHSYLFRSPEYQLPLDVQQSLNPPSFSVRHGDPVDLTIEWAKSNQSPVPFICQANDRRAGGDWETGVVGYEERLCRRSNLSATLSTPAPDSVEENNYPIPAEGGILSEHVVVFRGKHDSYKVLDDRYCIPVVSITGARWPKLSNGTAFAFPLEREMVKNKIRAALRICAYRNYQDIVIGDWGLGNALRNPPQALAEVWREVFLYDPDLRGRFRYVVFCFEDGTQSTTRLILEDMEKKGKGSSSSKGKSKASKSSSSSSSSSNPPSSSYATPTDYEIFANVFDNNEIQAVLSTTDPRFHISNITS